MARLARAEVFASDEIAIVHVMNRTVRRCFLLGDDPVSGTNHDHRKLWVDDQLIHQAKHFGIDLLCQAIMSNHFHLVLRSRPDVVAQWDDTEIARRWLMLCPLRRDKQRRPREPTEPDLDTIRNDKVRLSKIRSRLSDISWWMRLLSQNIAQRANKEDGEVGKFWQARYRACRLIDETAILSCAAYVDLNPIRAALAETIEESDLTSAQKRASAMQARHGRKSPGKPAGTQSPQIRSINAAQHLAPVELKSGGELGPDPHRRGSRCSNKGFLPMSAADYLMLLDWTARHACDGRTGSTPERIAPIFSRLGISADVWLALVQNFGQLFSVVAGQPAQVDAYRSKVRRQRYHMRKEARELMTLA